MAADPVATAYFEATIAHAFIIFTSLFAIFWGMVNVLFVRKVNITDTKIIIKALEDSGEAKE